MLTAVVTRNGASLDVRFVAGTDEEDLAEGEEFHAEDCEFEPESDTATECGAGPSPIVPEVKELMWGAGAFIVFALLMRYYLFPKLKAGMDARYASIRGGHEHADAVRAAARAEVAEYETAVAAVRAEANQRIDAARQTLESERQAQLAEANARVSTRREAAADEARAAREAVSADISSAVADVTGRAVEMATGKRPSDATIQSAVSRAMGTEVLS